MTTLYVRDQSGFREAEATDVLDRALGLRADGLELEYDLPNAATGDERARDWQFPARVFKPFAGPAQLLNDPELEARVSGQKP